MAGGLVLLIIQHHPAELLFGFFAIVLTVNQLRALKRSHRLVWGNWWRTLVVVSVPVVIVMILYLGLGIAFGATPSCRRAGPRAT